MDEVFGKDRQDLPGGATRITAAAAATAPIPALMLTLPWCPGACADGGPPGKIPFPTTEVSLGAILESGPAVRGRTPTLRGHLMVLRA
jgi:hypothetical protein